MNLLRELLYGIKNDKKKITESSWSGQKAQQARTDWSNMTDEEVNRRVLSRAGNRTPKETANALEKLHIENTNEYWNRIKKFHPITVD